MALLNANVRLPQLIIALSAIATTLSTNLDLLPLTPTTKGLVSLTCLCILALNRSILEPHKETSDAQ